MGANDDGNQSDEAGYSHGQGAGHGYDCSSHHARENRCDEVVANGNDYSARFEGLRPESAVRQWGPRVWVGGGGGLTNISDAANVGTLEILIIQLLNGNLQISGSLELNKTVRQISLVLWRG